MRRVGVEQVYAHLKATEEERWAQQTADEWCDEQAEFYAEIADFTASYLLDGPGGDDEGTPLLVPLRKAA